MVEIRCFGNVEIEGGDLPEGIRLLASGDVLSMDGKLTSDSDVTLYADIKECKEVNNG